MTTSAYLDSTQTARAGLICAALAATLALAMPALAQDAGARQFGQSSAPERQFSDSLRPAAVQPAKPKAPAKPKVTAKAKAAAKAAKLESVTASASRTAHFRPRHQAAPVATAETSPPVAAPDVQAATPTPAPEIAASAAPQATKAPAAVAPAASPAPQAQQSIPIVVYGIGLLIAALLAAVAAFRRPKARGVAKAAERVDATPPRDIEPTPEPLPAEVVPAEAEAEPAIATPEPAMSEAVAIPVVVKAQPAAPRKATVQKREAAAKPQPAAQALAPVGKAPAKKAPARPKAGAAAPAANDDASGPKTARRRKSATGGAAGK